MGRGAESPASCPTPSSQAAVLSGRHLPLGFTPTDVVAEKGSECGPGQRQPGVCPSAGEEAPVHKVSGWVAQEAIMEEPPGVLRAEPVDAVAAVLGLGFCRR